MQNGEMILMSENVLKNRKNPEKWKKALDTVREKIELEKRIVTNTHRLEIALWIRYHAVTGTDFVNLKHTEKQKLFEEYKSMYESAFNKKYVRFGTRSEKSQSVTDFCWSMERLMKTTLENLDKENIDPKEEFTFKVPKI